MVAQPPLDIKQLLAANIILEMFLEQRKIRVHYNGLRESPALLHSGTHHIVEAALRQPRALGPFSLLVFSRPQSVRTLSRPSWLSRDVQATYSSHQSFSINKFRISLPRLAVPE